ncbi:MAG TPA: hypothetical protein VLT36_07350 [Candidatus Dormibacteraeota bacterium]|nr:hypothetical protein [Candidatus Dormibacteraeota bacterium]
MKVFLTLLLTLLASAVLAQPPSYDYTRKTVIEQNPKCQIPETERVFVSDRYQSSFIIRIKDDLTLRQIIDQTKYKDKEVPVVVLRSGLDTPFNYPFWRTVKPAEKPTFSLKPGDVVLLGVGSW